MEETEKINVLGATTGINTTTTYMNGLTENNIIDIDEVATDMNDTSEGTSDGLQFLQNIYGKGLSEGAKRMEEYGMQEEIEDTGTMDYMDEPMSNKDSITNDLYAQDDLRALGISVVDQVTLERDVEAAVDKAVAQHTRKQRFKILQKDVKELQMTIKKGDNKLREMKNRLAAMRQRVVDPKYYMGVEAEVRTKTQEMKTLRDRQLYLQEKLSNAENNKEELDDYELEDGEIEEEEDEEQISKSSERERLIREGLLTPFGTRVNSSSNRTPSTLQKSVPVPQSILPPPSTLPKSSPVRPLPKPRSGKIDSKPKESTSGTGTLDFEKYLQDQIKRQKEHSVQNKGVKRKVQDKGASMYGIPKKKKTLREYKGVFDEEVDKKKKDGKGKERKIKGGKREEGKEKEMEIVNEVNKKDPLKKSVLFPKKRRVAKVLGSVTSELEADMYKEVPRRILSERMSFEGSESESEVNESDYEPSAGEWEEEDEEWVFDKEEGGKERSEGSTVKQKRGRKRKGMSDEEWEMETSGVEKSTVKRRKGKGKKEKSDDDSNIKKQLSKDRQRYRDDGNLNDYMYRIKSWKHERLKEKHQKILLGQDLDEEEEEEGGCEEFDGGFKIPLKIWNKLYKYQRTCVRWLWELHGQGCGGILGDEMGLGKTIQVISFLVGLSYSGLRSKCRNWKGLGPVLIVCPATVIHQWVKEFHKWWAPFRVAVLHESGHFTGTKPALISNINSHCGILVTSYTGARDQLEVLLQYNWHYIILDEGHKIRNPEAQITTAVKRFQTPHRLILSGSPIQNNLKELWSLFDFVFPGKLGTLPVFLQQFAVPITQGGYANASKLEVQTAFKCASMLRDTINPYLLRRMKNDVRNHLNLPDKNEQVLFCGLTEEQKKIYHEYISGDQVNNILGGRMKVFVGLINLRKICNHPDLFTGGPRSFDGEYTSQLQPELRYGWWKRSGKMHVLESVLRLWSKQGHRALLFTQSRQMMCILERFLMDEQHTYLKMDGVTSVSARQPLIEKYNKDPSYFVFLLTTRVGGLGVNLTGADRVIIFDPDWNPSTDSQARERAWRIGQLRDVTIYRLLTAGTIEEKIYHRQIFKQFLTNRVLKDPKQQRFFKTNDLYELFTFTEGEKEKTESSAIFAGTGSEIKLGGKSREKEEGWREGRDKVIKLGGKKEERERKYGEGWRDVEEEGREKGGRRKRSGEGEKEEMMEEVSGEEEEIEMEIENVENKRGRKEKGKENEREIENEEGREDERKRQRERMRELAKKLSRKIVGEEMKEGKEEKERNKKGELENNVKEGEIGNKMIKIEGEEGSEGTKEGISLEDNYNVENISLLPPPNSTLVILPPNSAPQTPNSTSPPPNSTPLPSNTSQAPNSTSPPPNSISSPPNSTPPHPNTSQHTEENTNLEKNERRRKKKEKKKEKEKDRKKEEKKREKEKSLEEKLKKGKKFEGKRIEFLVKKRKYKKTEEEEEEEKGNAKSQDQYVLERLFKNSGVHTALRHDVIVESGDKDYMLIEGEAERVAKEALKAVRASRAWCQRPRPTAVGNGGREKAKEGPRFGRKKSSLFRQEKEEGKEEEEKEKKTEKPMFSGGMVDEIEEDEEEEGVKKGFSPFKSKPKFGKAEGSGVITSSQLLSRMRSRNQGLSDSDSDYDPDYPSTAVSAPEIPEGPEVSTEVKENIELLADIRNFVAFQAEVDGRASTQEILGRFRERLPPDKTPLFKALLNQICDFHREMSGKGMWSLKGEFR